MSQSRAPYRALAAAFAATLITGFAGATGTAAQAEPASGITAKPDPGPVARLAARGLDSTIALNNCSGSLVRYPSSTSSERAMLLTNGHCYEGGFIGAGEVLVDQPSSRSGTLLDAEGNSIGSVRADRILYATMTGTDAALYRLTDTFAAIESRTGAKALTMSDTKPTDGAAISIPSSYWKRTYSCSVDGFVSTLKEGEWTWQDSIRYGYPDSDCVTIGGTSGSPIIDDSSLEVVGVNNTTNEDGRVCEVNNPCEVGENGQPTVQKGQNYGQQTYWFMTCLTSTNTIDLGRSGCLLPS